MDTRPRHAYAYWSCYPSNVRFTSGRTTYELPSRKASPLEAHSVVQGRIRGNLVPLSTRQDGPH